MAESDHELEGPTADNGQAAPVQVLARFGRGLAGLAVLAGVNVVSVGTSGETVAIEVDQHASAAIKVALHLLEVLVVRALGGAGAVLRVGPDIFGAVLHAVALKVHVVLDASGAFELGRALKAGGLAVQALVVIEQVGLGRALGVAQVVVHVAVEALQTESVIEALVAVGGAGLTGAGVGGRRQGLTVEHDGAGTQAQPVEQVQAHRGVGVALGAVIEGGARQALGGAQSTLWVVGEGICTRVPPLRALGDTGARLVCEVPVPALEAVCGGGANEADGHALLALVQSGRVVADGAGRVAVVVEQQVGRLAGRAVVLGQTG